MGYIEQNLNPGENILYQTRRHWMVLFGPAVLAAIFGIPGLFTLLGAVLAIGDKSGASGGIGAMAFVMLAIAALSLGLGILSRNATEMAVTNKRVIIKTGIISKRTIELFLTKVESVGVEQGLFGRMLGYGSIVVRGTGGTHEPFTKVASPLEFRRHVQQQIELQEQGKSAIAGR